MQTFDDFDNMDNGVQSNKPFQFREDKTEEGTLKWLNDNFTLSWEESFTRRVMYRRLMTRYKNMRIDDGDGMFKTSNRDRGETGRKPRVRVNFFYEFTEQRVAQMSRNKTNVGFVPKNDSEESDRNNAKACKLLTQSRMEEIGFESIMRDQDRKTYLFGHSFAYVHWDPEQGPYKDQYEMLLKKKPGTKIPRMDEEGKIIEGKYLKDEELRLGDVCIEIKSPDLVYPERLKYSWEKINHLDCIEWMDKEEAKARWKNKKEEIDGESSGQQTYYDNERQQEYMNNDLIMIRTFWHKPTKFFPEGCKIIYCDKCILSWEDFPYKHKMLPFIPDLDIEVPNEFWGRPFLINIEQLSKMYDMVQSGIARNHGVASAPKLAYPEGSINVKDANNEYGSLAFRGPTAPQYIQHQYVNRGEFEIQDRLEKRMMRFSSIFEVSQGEVPAGITAYSAIRYLDEQETQRSSNTIAKRKERILKIYKHVIGLMAQYYTKDDSRMARLVGKSNEYIIQSFKKFDFNMIYDVREENISALSDTRGGRIADIIDINTANQKDPTFGKKEIIKLLDLGLDDAFKEENSYAPDTARTIMQMIYDGEPAPSPEDTDDLIEWYFIFSRQVESPQYKFKTSPQVKAVLDNYIEALELLMYEKSKVNPVFAQKAAMFDKYPIFLDVVALKNMEQAAIQEMVPPMPPLGAAPSGSPAMQEPVRTPKNMPTGGLETSEMDVTREAIQKELDKEQENQPGVN